MMLLTVEDQDKNEAYCPVCGEHMMLCDEYLSAENDHFHCDWHEDKNEKPKGA